MSAIAGNTSTGLIKVDYKKALLLVFLWVTNPLSAQLYNDSLGFFEKSQSLNKSRLSLVVGGETIGLTATFLALNQLWYVDYPKSSFHTHNDNGNWLQMDKIGHALTAYHVGNAGMEMLEWSGVKHKTSVWAGGTLGLAFLSGVEILDGGSEEWGFSWGDMAANLSGTALLIGQELLWKEQRITMKFSSHYSPYAKVSPELLGTTTASRVLKDYNGQTYWLSLNIHSLTSWETWPAWLNVAVGYGADGMVTAKYQQDFYESHTNYNWQRQFYASLDIDLRKIPVKSPFLKTLFGTLNFIKIPMPTIEWNQHQSPAYHWIYF